MLNRAEFNQLKSQMLSHLARTMYLFYLRPNAPQGAVSVDPVALTSDLVSHSAIMPCNPTLELIEGALLELEQEHLIARVMPNIPWQGALIIFPLFAQELLEVPHAPFRMYAQWQPGPSFRNAALMAGLLDYSYQEPELMSFINFWLERAALHNQYGWERLFIQRLLKLRSANTLVQASERRKRRLKSTSELGPNTIKSSHAQDAVLPATVTKRGVNNETCVRSNHYGTTMQAEQIPTLRGMLSGTPQYEAVAAGYTDEVSKELMAASGTLGYQTFSAAPSSSTGELLPRFDGSTPAPSPAVSAPNAPLSSTVETSTAKDSLAPAGGFDFDYLKELDAAFATTSNSDLLASQATAPQAETAATQGTHAETTATQGAQTETAVHHSSAPQAIATPQAMVFAQPLTATQSLTSAPPVPAIQPMAAPQPEAKSATDVQVESVHPQTETARPTVLTAPTYADQVSSTAQATIPKQSEAQPQALAPRSKEAVSHSKEAVPRSKEAAPHSKAAAPRATTKLETAPQAAPKPKAATQRGKQAAGGYQRMDFSKLGIEAEIS